MGWLQNRGVCVHHDALAAASLGLVDGVVCGDEVTEAAAGQAGDGYTDRDGDPHCLNPVPGGGELGDPLADALGDLEGLGGCGAGQQHGEFLAAEPAAQVAVAQQVPHGGGDRGEHGVPGEVAVVSLTALKRSMSAMATASAVCAWAARVTSTAASRCQEPAFSSPVLASVRAAATGEAWRRDRYSTITRGSATTKATVLRAVANAVGTARDSSVA
jgi:hypothetical protein